MIFYIQACNPKCQNNRNLNDVNLADAIESAFPLKTENAILVWNYISIPLSYKYDISYMMDDILRILDKLQSKEMGELIIHWLPDTFRCDWKIKWDLQTVHIQANWENVVGELQDLLNKKNTVTLPKESFINEWKNLLGIVVNGLKGCGYNEENISGINQLIEQYERIRGKGILYYQSE